MHYELVREVLECLPIKYVLVLRYLGKATNVFIDKNIALSSAKCTLPETFTLTLHHYWVLPQLYNLVTNIHHCDKAKIPISRSRAVYEELCHFT